MLILLPLLGLICNNLISEVAANLSLGFKAVKLQRQQNPANCIIGNTTFAHGSTFKLDCKTQCVCENGRHACSSLCPKEQLPAPEDTISCRSPRLVEVPGHCCKMWLCENPTADVYATCHNSSSSPWTPCSRSCGLGMSTRSTSTTTGCRQLSNLRLCENHKCSNDNNNNNKFDKQLSSKSAMAAAASNLIISHSHKDNKNKYGAPPHEHRVRKGHECRSIQRLGPARIRLGACVSRKLYRPKLCGHCHHAMKCCAPSVSTTIQIEMLCPLNAVDPINFAAQQQSESNYEGYAVTGAAEQLWDTQSLEPIDQEFLQSHQIQIENKFIAVEWILKCDCTKNICNHISDKSYNISTLNPNNKNNKNVSANSDDDVDNHRNDSDEQNAQYSHEVQPDIIPYPESRRTTKQQHQRQHRRQRT